MVITPNDHFIEYQDPLRVTCVATVGSQVSYDSDPTTIDWLDARGQLIVPIDGQVRITERIDVIEGAVFVESVLDICSTSFQHYGLMRCNARRVVVETIAVFNVTAVDIVPAQLTATPASQLVDCRAGVTLACSAIGFPVASVTWWFNGSMVLNNASDNVNIYTELNVTQQMEANATVTNSFLEIVSVGANNIGSYVCSTENPIGSEMSRPGT